MIGFPLIWYSHTIFFWCSNIKYLGLIKRRSKVQKINMSCKRTLNFDQWKPFSENYKPIRIWLSLVYKFTHNYCRSRLFSKFIQTQKRYPTSLDKMRILTWKLLVISIIHLVWYSYLSYACHIYHAISHTSCELNS